MQAYNQAINDLDKELEHLKKVFQVFISTILFSFIFRFYIKYITFRNLLATCMKVIHLYGYGSMARNIIGFRRSKDQEYMVIHQIMELQKNSIDLFTKQDYNFYS